LVKKDEILDLAVNNCVDIVKTKNNSKHENVDAYEIIYTHESLLSNITDKLHRGWFIKGNKLYVYWRIRND